MCFCCDEKYLSGHKCKAKEQRELRMFVVRENNEEVEIIKEDDFEKERDEFDGDGRGGQTNCRIVYKFCSWVI